MACYEFLRDHKAVNAAVNPFRHQCRCLTAVGFSRQHYIMHRRNLDFDELCFSPPQVNPEPLGFGLWHVVAFKQCL
ncbi:hypothetical protein BT96DRAFT_555421 [Gymnopus androsaceus JB14]|uniref:Uncharacterized protein n=1 Tax=Gymnopus androsaceus JB14 TaxID=1447944 RepID=A0A6A4GL83_9AGAR|nr:hypothetical protein BT96DRAFT_555421 [Gymnopus androsaceus JB14]